MVWRSSEAGDEMYLDSNRRAPSTLATSYELPMNPHETREDGF